MGILGVSKVQDFGNFELTPMMLHSLLCVVPPPLDRLAGIQTNDFD